MTTGERRRCILLESRSPTDGTTATGGEETVTQEREESVIYQLAGTTGQQTLQARSFFDLRRVLCYGFKYKVKAKTLMLGLIDAEYIYRITSCHEGLKIYWWYNSNHYYV